MDFSLTTLFVVPPSNVLPVAGSTQDLVAGKFGVFDNAYVIAGAGTIAAKPYIYLAQGRQADGVPGLGSKRSDKINKLKVTEWYKVTAEADLLPQISTIGGFTVQCAEDVTVTLRLHSNYIDQTYYNGLTRSVMVTAPCCDCGELPCEDLDAADVEALVDELITKLRADELLVNYVTFDRTGSGATSTIVVTGKAIPSLGIACDPTGFAFEYDRIWFRAFVHTGPETTQDFVVDDACDQVAVVNVQQRASYQRGTAKEIQQLEKNLFSYQTTYKHLFNNPIYNGSFTSEVVANTFYDTYVIKFKQHEDDTWYGGALLDETVIVAFPTGEGAAFETLMEVYLGDAVDKSGTNRTSTTTTSTSSTTTTSTTEPLTP